VWLESTAAALILQESNIAKPRSHFNPELERNQRFIPEEFGGKTVARRIVIAVGQSLLTVPLVRHIEHRSGERLSG
jgi:hypothetical protein